MRTAQGFGRLVGFSDGVVAIAITLLVLPLVESVTEVQGNIAGFVDEHGGQLFAFVLSFVVIGNFWVVHHQMYERAQSYTKALLWLNLLWLMSIVFLPFPTALLAADAAHPTTLALYMGTMIVTTASGYAQQVVLYRNPELQTDEARGTLQLLPYGSTTILLVIALALALAVPSIGIWSLLLLFAATPLEALIRRITRKPAP